MLRCRILPSAVTPTAYFLYLNIKRAAPTLSLCSSLRSAARVLNREPQTRPIISHSVLQYPSSPTSSLLRFWVRSATTTLTTPTSTQRWQKPLRWKADLFRPFIAAICCVRRTASPTTSAARLTLRAVLANTMARAREAQNERRCRGSGHGK